MCGTIGCQQTIASECRLFGNSVVERSKHSRESPNTKPPTHGKENISVAANLFLEIKVFFESPSRDVLIS
ncbi:hypothetical protein DPMN_111481 [Dreissena polymorpha]|uniref:Uncharacterized protein n=1 Tax=Dreissena polymorpha TaxID=45954 RepID=A0A9D4KEI5_DREPO|nr:hypothetical protein DPMN_111481 [Dreissena polymorpha]